MEHEGNEPSASAGAEPGPSAGGDTGLAAVSQRPAGAYGEAPGEVPKLELGEVISTTARIISGNLAVLLPIAVVFEIPEFLMSLGVGFLQATNADGPAMTMTLLIGALSIVSGIVQMVLTAIAQGAISFVTIESLADEPVSLGEALSKGLSRLGPLILTSILVSIVVGFGMLLCIAPGLIASLMFAVTIPVVVIESLSGPDAMRRSFHLTEGNRVPILLCYLVMAAPLVLIVCVVSAVSGGLAAALAGANAVWVQTLFSAVLQFLMGVPFLLIYAVVPAVLYVRLRDYRDGVDVRALAEVFA